jgi:hypothetical protein
VWTPILAGEEQARAALSAITERQLHRPLATGAAACDLMRGDVGRAVFLAYLARATGDVAARDHARMLLERAVDHLDEASSIPTFHSGFTGCAWALAHLGDELGIDADTTAIDEALHDILEARPSWLEFEWLVGVAGMAIYALERRQTSLLAQMVSYFEEAAERDGDRLTWRTPDTTRTTFETVEHPYSLPPAHGVTGALAALAGIGALGIETTRSRALVDSAFRWLLAHRLDDTGAMFRTYSDERTGRFGWCNGDTGIAGALAAAGRVLDAPELVETSIAVGHRIVVATENPPYLLGRELCHGWPGVAHVLSRLYHQTQHEMFAIAARRACTRMLALPPEPDDSLLTGSAGIGIVLVSAVLPTEPTWDRALLLSFA